jgi:Tfp pilus assembly protein PilN
LGKKGDKLAVFLFAVPKTVLDEILDALSTFGIKPVGMETPATALSNYLLFCTGVSNRPVVVLGGQSDAWEMVGLGCRTKGWYREPEMLFAHGLHRADWNQGSGAEIFHSFLHQSPKVFSWGPVQDFLLSVKEESIQAEDLLALGNERLGLQNGAGDPLLVPAVGASLCGLREGTFSVNLLPEGGKREQGRMLSRLNGFLIAILLICVTVLGGSYAIRDEFRLRRLQKEIRSLEPSVESLRKKEDELNRLVKEMSSLSRLSERRGEVLRVLNELTEVVPNEAYLSNLRYREGAIDLKGTAENASTLVPLLERSSLFEEVEFNAPSTRRSENRETFSLKAKVEEQERALKP